MQTFYSYLWKFLDFPKNFYLPTPTSATYVMAKESSPDQLNVS